MKFFAASGMQVTGTAANRYMIDVTGRVADVARALHVTMNMYKHPTQNRLFIAPDREPTLDRHFTLHITGLDVIMCYRHPVLCMIRAAPAKPALGRVPAAIFWAVMSAQLIMAAR